MAGLKTLYKDEVKEVVSKVEFPDAVIWDSIFDETVHVEKLDPTKKIEGWGDSITHDILTQVVSLRDKSFIDSIIRYAELKGIDELILLDEEAIKQVISLGLEAYNKLEHEDPASYIYRTSR